MWVKHLLDPFCVHVQRKCYRDGVMNLLSTSLEVKEANLKNERWRLLAVHPIW
jgi:hypothetical protein